MSRSNWNLRFDRTAREAYGHDIDFDDNIGDRFVFVISIFAVGFILGLLAV